MRLFLYSLLYFDSISPGRDGEMADTRALRALIRKGVRVRVPLPVPNDRAERLDFL